MSQPTNAAPLAVRCSVLDTVDQHGIGVITLDAPKSLNALSLPMVQQVDEQLRRWREDPRIVAVWMESSSDKAFCAGADLRSLYQSMQADRATSHVAEFFAAEYRLDFLIHNYGKPVVAWLHGITMGGGIGLGCGATHRVVTEASQFAMPEISIGLFPDVAASWFLGRVAGYVGRYLGITGARLTPADTLSIGLADLPVPHARKRQVQDALRASRWSGICAEDSTVASRVLSAAADWNMAEGSELARRTVALSQLCSAPTLLELVAGIHAFAQKDEWARPHAKMLSEGSPLSAALAWELQKRLKYASLAEVFRLEYNAALGCAEGDFPEGIRALIIDKDRSPRWHPASIAQVTSEMVERLLRPRWQGAHPLRDLELSIDCCAGEKLTQKSP